MKKNHKVDPSNLSAMDDMGDDEYRTDEEKGKNCDHIISRNFDP